MTKKELSEIRYEYLEEFIDAHPYTIALCLIGLAIGFIIDNIEAKKN